jgi:cytochrome P450
MIHCFGSECKCIRESQGPAVRNRSVGADAVSLFVASDSSNQETAFVRTIMLAGHDTTANTLSWTLYELTKQRHLQDKLRAEIDEKILEKGSDMLTEHDYESMPYLTAITKVRLRNDF